MVEIGPFLNLSRSAWGGTWRAFLERYPDFNFLFIEGSRDCPDFRFAKIDGDWDYQFVRRFLIS